jgi:hypothetical protein
MQYLTYPEIPADVTTIKLLAAGFQLFSEGRTYLVITVRPTFAAASSPKQLTLLASGQ